ncbi:TPA: DUF4365 domain-containing protein [Yersinia enterocolitica]|nr:DUF4365 domain-containing protein [Yersinia enterocolitica]
MIYPKKSATGQAGENYFAYWVSRYFKWPCRLLDIDVGIDAQVELFDDHSHSLGCFIGVQIKTTSDTNPNVLIKLNNLEYWNSMDDFVFLVSICMADDVPRMYWKHINDANIDKYIADAKLNSSQQITISFDSSDELIVQHKMKWKKLLLGDNRIIYVIQAKNLVSDIRKLKNIIKTEGNYNEIDIKNFVFHLNAICSGADFTGWPFDNKKLLSRQLNSVSLALSMFEESMDLFEKELKKIIILCRKSGRDVRSYINSNMTNDSFINLINEVTNSIN